MFPGVLRTCLVIVVLTSGLTVLSAGPALAGGRGGGGKPGGGTPTATLNISPNPAPAGGSTYWIAGCGYVNTSPVYLYVRHATTEQWGVFVWEGCISTSLTTAEAGTYTLAAYQATGKNQMTLMASATLVVQ